MSNMLLTTKEAAHLLRVSEAFLERDRWAGARVPFIKVGTRAVRYRAADLEAYIQAQARQSTSQRNPLRTDCHKPKSATLSRKARS